MGFVQGVSKFDRIAFSDVIIVEGEQAVTRDAATITNASGHDMTLQPGYPMNGNTPIVVAGQGTINGVLADHYFIPNGASMEVAVLKRGPAVVNKDKLMLKDHAGATFNLTTVAASIETGCPLVKVRTEGAGYSMTQET